MYVTCTRNHIEFLQYCSINKSPTTSWPGFILIESIKQRKKIKTDKATIITVIFSHISPLKPEKGWTWKVSRVHRNYELKTINKLIRHISLELPLEEKLKLKGVPISFLFLSRPVHITTWKETGPKWKRICRFDIRKLKGVITKKNYHGETLWGNCETGTNYPSMLTCKMFWSTASLHQLEKRL